MALIQRLSLKRDALFQQQPLDQLHSALHSALVSLPELLHSILWAHLKFQLLATVQLSFLFHLLH